MRGTENCFTTQGPLKRWSSMLGTHENALGEGAPEEMAQWVRALALKSLI